MTTTKATQQICELAPSYVLGALTTDEASAFDAHLAEGCEVCLTELESLAAVTADLTRSAATQPRPELRNRVMERIAGLSALAQQPIVAKDGLLFARSAKIDWAAIPVPGIELKALNVDTERGVSTQLVRMQPGATYPTHRHAGTEELFLLEGDLEVSGVHMRAGDYCRAEVDTIHSGVRSHGGCLFISTASLNDELFA